MDDGEIQVNNYKSIEAEIKTVNDLCGQLENYVKQPKKDKVPNNQTYQNNQYLYKKYLKNERGRINRTNNSIDTSYSSRKDKFSPSVKLVTPVKNKNLSVDTRNDHGKNHSCNNEILKTSTSNSTKTDVFNRLYKEKTSASKYQEEHKKTMSLNTQTKPNFKVDEMLCRFKELQIEKNNRLQEMKRKAQGVEKQNIKKVPEINKKSKKLGTVSDDFLTRMEKHKEASDKRKKEMIEKQEQKKADMEKLLLEEMSKNTKKLDKGYVKELISSMYEWDNNRKEKINKLKEKESGKEFGECTFKPDINKNSAKMAASKKPFLENGETVDRLYKQDVIKRKHKQEILQDIYAPSFTPLLNSRYNNGNMLTEANYSDKKPTALNVDYITSKDNNMIEEILRERVKMLRNKNMDN